MDPAGIIAPMEISSSPEIIRSPMGNATIPRLAAKFTQLAAPSMVPRSTPPKTTKKATTATRLRMAPASGRRIKGAISAFFINPPSALLLCGIGERHLPERVVRQHGDQEKGTDDDRAQIGVESGEIDALIDDGKCDGAEQHAHDGSESAGQQHPADHHAHDRVEDEGLPAGDLRALIDHRLADADKSRAEAR